MKEESSYDFRISIRYWLKFRGGEINGFRKVYFMIEGIKKRSFERFRIKVISGEIKRLKFFHYKNS